MFLFCCVSCLSLATSEFTIKQNNSKERSEETAFAALWARVSRKTSTILIWWMNQRMNQFFSEELTLIIFNESIYVIAIFSQHHYKFGWTEKAFVAMWSLPRYFIISQFVAMWWLPRSGVSNMGPLGQIQPVQAMTTPAPQGQRQPQYVTIWRAMRSGLISLT